MNILKEKQLRIIFKKNPHWFKLFKKYLEKDPSIEVEEINESFKSILIYKNSLSKNLLEEAEALFGGVFKDAFNHDDKRYFNKIKPHIKEYIPKCIRAWLLSGLLKDEDKMDELLNEKFIVQNITEKEIIEGLEGYKSVEKFAKKYNEKLKNKRNYNLKN